jgi:hypothetical protein
MKATQMPHDMGQCLRPADFTRDPLTAGTGRRCIDDPSATGLASNPTIFGHAIKNTTADGTAICETPADAGFRRREDVGGRPLPPRATARRDDRKGTGPTDQEGSKGERP